MKTNPRPGEAQANRKRESGTLEERTLYEDIRLRERSLDLEQSKLKSEIARSLAIALIVVSVPLAAQINGCQIQKTQQFQSEADLAFKYLGMAVDPQYDDQRQMRVLQFVIRTLPKEHTAKEWAEDELKRVSQTLEKISENERVEKELTAELRAENSRGMSALSGQTEKERSLQKQIDELTRERLILKNELRTSRMSSGTPRLNLDGFSMISKNQCCVVCGGGLHCGAMVRTVCGNCSALSTDL